MSDQNAKDTFGFASEQAPHPQALVGARNASSQFRGRWRRSASLDGEAPAPFSQFDDVHGDDPSIWSRASEPTPHAARNAASRDRDEEAKGFLSRAASVAFRKLMGS